MWLRPPPRPASSDGALAASAAAFRCAQSCILLCGYISLGGLGDAALVLLGRVLEAAGQLFAHGSQGHFQLICGARVSALAESDFGGMRMGGSQLYAYQCLSATNTR